MRLKQRIEESGLSLQQISERAKISLDRLGSLLEGVEPSIVELRDLADAMRLSISDFLPNAEPEQKANLLFRQTIQRRPKERTIKAPIENFSRKVGQALELLTEAGPPTNWMKELRPSAQNYADAELQAEKFRRLFFGNNQVAPILSLPAIAVEQLGVVLYLVDNGEFEGASAFVGRYPFVFVSRRTFPPRMLFTLAHELGHLIAHHDEGDFAVVDVSGDVEQMRPRVRTDEAFSDAFASCLLLPPAGVGSALKTIREVVSVHENAIGDIELLYVSRFFGVSFQVAAKRCEDLKLLPVGGGASLYEHVAKVHGNPEKYANELGLPKRSNIDFPALPPRLLKDAVESIRSGRVSIGRASSILNLSIADLFRVHAGA